jgi:pyroglutamyl-peptidase
VTAPILIAAFEPFDGRSRNRSWEIVRRLPDRPGLEKVQLSVDLTRLDSDLTSLLRLRRPRAVLLLGESPTPRACVEQLAINLFDADRSPAGQRRSPVTPVRAGDDLARKASWDARAVAAQLNDAGIPAMASFHAGAFACNAALYLALAAAVTPRVGFLHVPRRRWPFGLRMGQLTRAAGICLDTLLALPDGSPG